MMRASRHQEIQQVRGFASTMLLIWVRVTRNGSDSAGKSEKVFLNRCSFCAQVRLTTASAEEISMLLSLHYRACGR